METVSLVNHFLIAMPAMDDPNISRTLTFICEHNADGAIGIIVNRPTDLNLAGLFDRVSIPLEDESAEARFADLPVYFGGPVQTDRGFVLHRPAGQWQSSLNISDSIALTTVAAADNDARFAAIAGLIAEWQPQRLLVGRPLSDDGTPHEMTARCERFADQLRGRFRLPVDAVDERYSSLEADAGLRGRGIDWRSRKAQVDAEAALIILNDWNDTHARSATA